MESGSDKMTGSEILVKSWPINLLIIDHTGTTSFGVLKNGSLILEGWFPLTIVNISEPMKVL